MSEKELHRSICNYLKEFHPGLLFNTDMAGVRLTQGQAIQAKGLRSCKGFPDIVIYEPAGKYHGLFLEVKNESPCKKDGTLKSDKHLQEQHALHLFLQKKGYAVWFVWQFNQAVLIIENYLSLGHAKAGG